MVVVAAMEVGTVEAVVRGGYSTSGWHFLFDHRWSHGVITYQRWLLWS